MARKGQAGYSARRRARELRRRHVQESLTWAAWAAGAGTALVTLISRELSVGSLVGGGLAGVVVAVWRLRGSSEASRWLQGSKAEKRTGALLSRLKPLGWEVLHDLQIPGSKANLDHVVVHPSGLFLIYVDTKAWHVEGAKIRYKEGRLLYGRWNQTGKLDTVRWEASRLAEETGLTVIPVIACDRGNVIGSPNTPGVIKIDDAYVISSGNLYQALVSMNQLTGPDPCRVNSVTRTIGRRFAAAQ